MRAVYKLAPLMSRDNTIVFKSYPDYADNAKVLFEYLQSAGFPQGYRAVWAIESSAADVPSITGAEIVSKADTPVKYARAISKAAYVFDTHTRAVPHGYSIPKGQKLIVLWHGCGFKGRRTAGDVSFSAMFVPGPLFVKTKSDFFRCDESKVIPIGYPRYDILLKDPSEGAHIQDLLPQAAGKTIFWMPTYRENDRGFTWMEGLSSETGIPLIDTVEQLQELDEVCAANSVSLVIKRHPMQRAFRLPEGVRLSNVYFIDNENLKAADIDLYEIMRDADAMVTDCSSAGVDYLLLDRPLAYVLDDFEEYGEAQGYIVDDPREYMPGAHIYTLDNLKSFVTEVALGEDDYKSARAKARDIMHNPCNCYCERVAQWAGLKAEKA